MKYDRIVEELVRKINNKEVQNFDLLYEKRRICRKKKIKHYD